MSEHRIIYQEAITPAATEAVCSCGAVVNSYGSTVAQRFGQHVTDANKAERLDLLGDAVPGTDDLAATKRILGKR